MLGAEEDDGILVIKSGTDFRDLSDIQIELSDSPAGSVRRKYISAVKGSLTIILHVYNNMNLTDRKF
jgi:hypothetical protein